MSECHVMHLLVIGFHPRSGYRVEFCTPSLQCGNNNNLSEDIILPPEWECLRYLALPDGAHNHDQDTIYFSMPNRKIGEIATDREKEEHTIFGVSCYKQIYVTNRVGDGVRGSIQKSVCILANRPLYSLLESKLRWVTEAFFRQIQRSFSESKPNTENDSNSSVDDASRVPNSATGAPEEMLKVCFDHIQLMLSSEYNAHMVSSKSSASISSSCKEIENNDDKKSIADNDEDGSVSAETVSSSPSHNLSSSYEPLFYEQIPLSQLITQIGASKLLLLFKLVLLEPRIVFFGPRALPIGQLMLSICALLPEMLSKGMSKSHCVERRNSTDVSSSSTGDTSPKAKEFVSDDATSDDPRLSPKSSPKFTHSLNNLTCPTTTDCGLSQSTELNLNSNSSNGASSAAEEMPDASELLPKMVNTASVGYPLQIYSNGNIWIPYASLHQLSALQQHDKAFSVGCTNALFISSHGGLSCDVVVNIDEKEISFDWRNHDIKKLLHLSIEDIRFSNELTNAAQKHVKSQGIDWEGGEQYVRLNFNLYLSSLLLSIYSRHSKQISCFYTPFCRAYEKTTNYHKWKRSISSTTQFLGDENNVVNSINSVCTMDTLLHPGSLHESKLNAAGMNLMWDDMSLRWNHMSSVSQRYKRVSQTRKVVTNAARSAFGTLWGKGASKKTSDENGSPKASRKLKDEQH